MNDWVGGRSASEKYAVEFLSPVAFPLFSLLDMLDR